MIGERLFPFIFATIQNTNIIMFTKWQWHLKRRKPQLLVKKRDIIDFVYCFIWGFYVLINELNYTLLVDQSSFSTWVQVSRYTAIIVLLLLTLFNNTIPLRYGILVSIVVPLTIYATRTIYSLPIIVLVLFIVCAQQANFKHVVFTSLVAQLIVLALCLLGVFTGTVRDLVYTAEEGRIRHSLGYNYATYISKVFLFCLCYYFFLRKKVSLFGVIIFEGLNYLIFKYTNTRTVFYLASIFILAIYLVKRFNISDIKQPLKSLLVFVYPICAVFSFWIQRMYSSDPAKWSFLNLNNRLLMGKNALLEYGINLRGTNIMWVGMTAYTRNNLLTYNYVDNSYLYVLITYGVIFFSILMLFEIIIMQYAIHEKNFTLITILAMLAGYFIIESQIIDLAYNPFILLAGYSFSNTIRRRKKVGSTKL